VCPCGVPVPCTALPGCWRGQRISFRCSCTSMLYLPGVPLWFTLGVPVVYPALSRLLALAEEMLGEFIVKATGTSPLPRGVPLWFTCGVPVLRP